MNILEVVVTALQYRYTRSRSIGSRAARERDVGAKSPPPPPRLCLGPTGSSLARVYLYIARISHQLARLLSSVPFSSLGVVPAASCPPAPFGRLDDALFFFHPFFTSDSFLPAPYQLTLLLYTITALTLSRFFITEDKDRAFKAARVFKAREIFRFFDYSKSFENLKFLSVGAYL